VSREEISSTLFLENKLLNAVRFKQLFSDPEAISGLEENCLINFSDSRVSLKPGIKNVSDLLIYNLVPSG